MVQGTKSFVECATAFASKPAPTFEMHSNVGAGLLAKGSVQATLYADLAMINPVSLAASSRIAMNFDVGVWLPSPVLSSGTSGFTSG